MRWTHPTPPKKGDTRTVTAFLWWPKRIGTESRWLERTSWTERARSCEIVGEPATIGLWDWLPLGWVNP
jgi:hypothetical protein